MALDWTGIIVERDFYSEHYLKSVLEEDLRSVFTRWASDERNSPLQALATAEKEWSAAKAELDDLTDLDARRNCQREWLAPLFTALGYQWQPDERPAEDDASIPIVGEVARASGQPELWLLEALDASNELADPLMLPITPGDVSEDATSWEDFITDQVFSGPEPPRWVLLFHLGQLVLIERGRWAERRLLRFDFEKLLTSADARKLFAALVARDSISPSDGNNLLDRLAESSHKHAYEVSTDLKSAAREAIELLGNEALWYLREVRKEKVYGVIAQEDLSRECLRYLYRLLFLFYVEARPGLGYAPMDSDEYRDGYSLESLRELALVPLDSEESRGGWFLDASLRKLFGIVFHGFTPERQFSMAAGAETLATSRVHTFEIKPLNGDLFDEERTPILNRVRFRNQIWRRVLELLGYSRGGKALGRGRISYAQLGINQLGAVYEGLLSYSGFFAKADLYEVKKAGIEVDLLEQAWFVTRQELDQYEESEIVFDSETKRARVYPQGTFIYRLNGRNRQKSASYYTPEVLTRCVVKYALKELLANRASADSILSITVCEPALGSGAFLNEAINQLADAYLERKQTELGRRISERELETARQRVKAYLAGNQVFGVDRNPVAVELAEISLWLNTIYKGHTIPWFGNRLAVGNSLIGARREIFRKEQVASRSREWLDQVPERVSYGKARPADGVYHFLLPDDGMCRYDDKAVKAMCKAEITRIATWRRDFRREFDANESASLLRLSEAVDRLFERHTARLREARQRTEHKFPVFGHEGWTEHGQSLSTRERQKIFDDAIRPAIGPASDYQRLKFVMDYWCALWFWPIEQARLLPSRDEFLLESGMVLEGTLRATQTIRPTQGDMFSPEQPSLTVADEYGFVDLNAMCSGSERLALVRLIAERHRFFHWELEFADIFESRDGFDLILGNPPWIKITWNEGSVMGDVQPLYVLRSYTAPQLANLREATLRTHAGLRALYLDEYIEFEGTQSFLNARQNYPLLIGSPANTYKCFVTVSWSVANRTGVQGFLHPEGIYDDGNGGALREALYPRLRYHFQCPNELNLFPEISHARVYGINIYSSPRQTTFFHLANVFHPIVADSSFLHDGKGPVPSVKDDLGDWNLAGHSRRIIKVDQDMLRLFADLYDLKDTPPLQARLAAIHSQELVKVLKALSIYPHRLKDVTGEYTVSEMWNETGAVKAGTIRRETRFVHRRRDWVLSGPHFHVGTPLSQTPRAVCAMGLHYDRLDLLDLPDDYLPRSNYVPNCDDNTYISRIPFVAWDPKRRFESYYRYVNREMIDESMQRTLISAIVPPEVGHVNTVLGVAFKSSEHLVAFAGMSFSVPADFRVKSTGMAHANKSLLEQLPLPNGSPALSLRVLLLNCLTRDYVDLWHECFEDAFTEDSWAKRDPRLEDDRFRDLGPEWRWNSPLRSDFERRQALVEIDVLVAMELGLTCDELCIIYRVQFPILNQFERNTYYDQNGRIVYFDGDTACGLSTPEWKKNHDKDRIERTVEDDTLPTGKRTRTIVYEGPYDKCDREQDYHTVWAEFERRRQQA